MSHAGVPIYAGPLKACTCCKKEFVPKEVISVSQDGHFAFCGQALHSKCMSSYELFSKPPHPLMARTMEYHPAT